MTTRKDLLNLFKANAGKTVTTVKTNDLKGQAALHKKVGYQTSNLKEYFR